MKKDFIPNHYIYDLETYPNIFTFCIIGADGRHGKVFEISDRKNETEGLMNCLRYLKKNKCSLVGYNNIGFDYPIIHQIIEWAIEDKRAGKELILNAAMLYKLAQKQIDSFKGEGFGNTIKTEDEHIRQIDLYKIHHFDNKARSTSLKMLEFNMCADNIEDLPFPVGVRLSDEEKDVLIKYNKHDVLMTKEFYHYTVPAIRFREELSKKFKADFTNANDTKIGKDYFIMKLEKLIPGSCYKKIGRRKVKRQTKRDVIDLGECLFDYYDFKRPEFIAVQNWFKEQKITETKGVFTELEEHQLGEVAKYAVMRTKRKKFSSKPSQIDIDAFKKIHPCGWITEHELKSKKNAKSYWMNWKVVGKPAGDDKEKEGSLNVVVDDFRFDFGTGGIHGSVSNMVVHSDDDYLVIDADVTSMYPSIAIANKVYPEHLSKKFCDIYQDVFNTRAKYPKKTHPAENALFKLALNGVYGDSNNKYSPFYDPAYTMAITINGQLSLCLLSERLMNIPDMAMIQCNTDGVTVKIPRSELDNYYNICKDWEKKTGLMLEYANYKSMFIRDVNNYIAVTEDGKIKRKGAYLYETPLDNPDTGELGWNKNHSSRIIAKAAEAVMVHGKDLEEFIHGHDNKWDFMLRTKVPRSSRLVLEKDEKEIPLQNICRYYPSKDGGKLIKIMPPTPKQVSEGKTDERRLSIDKEWNVKPCNNIDEFEWDIDYDYYIEGAKKLILTY